MRSVIKVFLVDPLIALAFTIVLFNMNYKRLIMLSILQILVRARMLAPSGEEIAQNPEYKALKRDLNNKQ